MSTTPSPFIDHAEPILRGEPAITDDQRSQLWDIFHGSKDPNELVSKLMPMAVPDDLKQQLYDKKKLSVPAVAPLDKVTDAVNRIAQLDPKVRETVEASPNLLKAFTSAATAPEKTESAPAGASKPASKGKQAAGPKKTASAAPSVTPDIPATPPGHVLARASDGGMYHLPQENVEAAKGLDPGLQILHAEPSETEGA